MLGIHTKRRTYYQETVVIMAVPESPANLSGRESEMSLHTMLIHSLLFKPMKRRKEKHSRSKRYFLLAVILQTLGGYWEFIGTNRVKGKTAVANPITRVVSPCITLENWVNVQHLQGQTIVTATLWLCHFTVLWIDILSQSPCNVPSGDDIQLKSSFLVDSPKMNFEEPIPQVQFVPLQLQCCAK